MAKVPVAKAPAVSVRAAKADPGDPGRPGLAGGATPREAESRLERRLVRWPGFSLAAAGAVLWVSVAGADEPQSVARVLRALDAAGYHDIRAARTLLNRVRIVAERDGRRREIVVDPRTGELLRDYLDDGEAEVPKRGEAGIMGADREGARRGDDAEPGRDEDAGHQSETETDAEEAAEPR